jgi:hypothetical protein
LFGGIRREASITRDVELETGECSFFCTSVRKIHMRQGRAVEATPRGESRRAGAQALRYVRGWRIRAKL